MFARLKAFFRRLFRRRKRSVQKETNSENNNVAPMEPGSADQAKEFSARVEEDDQSFAENKNEFVMTTEHHVHTAFSSQEPLINLLTSFLSQRLEQLKQNDDKAVDVPPVPDWENSGKTLSAGFSRFIRDLDLKREEEYVSDESTSIECGERNGNMRVVVKKHVPLTDDEKWILIIALVPHIYPHYYDEVIFSHLENPGEYPQLGFIRGRDFRGFLPTGETIFFFLAGNDFDKRLLVQQIFQGDHLFANRKIIWLEELTKGEPLMSGKIIFSQDCLDTVMFGKPVPPGFSMNFPAKQIRTNLEWEDLVINADLKKQVEDIKDWLRFNEELEDQWGEKKRLKLGYRTLFYGPSGTGKTLSAGLLGKAVKKEVYKIDLSMVVSKFIGETEKNLEMLFARAEDKGWILFFDEADALFGKRTSVRDAHDKYANQEVSYLLQRIEDYNGLVILATNMRNNIDDAFVRRFNSTLSFSLPTIEERVLIWRKSFPPRSKFYKMPSTDLLAPDEDLEPVDIPQAVRKYELTGGNIINIVHFAGIRAVENLNERKNARKEHARRVLSNVDIDVEPDEEMEKQLGRKRGLIFYLSDVLEGIRREMIKEGKPFSS